MYSQLGNRKMSISSPDLFAFAGGIAVGLVVMPLLQGLRLSQLFPKLEAIGGGYLYQGFKQAIESLDNGELTEVELRQLLNLVFSSSGLSLLNSEDKNSPDVAAFVEDSLVNYGLEKQQQASEYLELIGILPTETL